MLQLDLEQLDHLDRHPGRAGERDDAVVVGGEDLLDVALGDVVAGRRPPVAGHQHAVGVGQRHHGGAVPQVELGAAVSALGGSGVRPGSRCGAAPVRKSTNDEPGAV